jgi:hypothetical protein
MTPFDPQQNNQQKPYIQGGRKPSFTIIHVDKNTPEAICIDLIAAKNEMAATTAAKRQFPNSTILRVSSSDDAIESSDYPDARYINGEFRPVDRATNLK